MFFRSIDIDMTLVPVGHQLYPINYDRKLEDVEGLGFSVGYSDKRFKLQVNYGTIFKLI